MSATPASTTTSAELREPFIPASTMAPPDVEPDERAPSNTMSAASASHAPMSACASATTNASASPSARGAINRDVPGTPLRAAIHQLSGSSQLSTGYLCHRCDEGISSVGWYRCTGCHLFDVCNDCAPQLRLPSSIIAAHHRSCSAGVDSSNIEWVRWNEVDSGPARSVQLKQCEAIIGRHRDILDDRDMLLVLKAHEALVKAPSDAPFVAARSAEAVYKFHMTAVDRPKHILSIDGGGIRAYSAVPVINAIIAHHKKTSSEFNQAAFALTIDYFVGTGMGALLAFCLAVDQPLEDVTKIFRNSRYFPRTWEATLIGPILWAQYNPRVLHAAIDKLLESAWDRHQSVTPVRRPKETDRAFGERVKAHDEFRLRGGFDRNTFTLSDLHHFILKQRERGAVLVVTAYDCTDNAACTFNSQNVHHAYQLVHDVLKSTLAVPTLFPIYQMKLVNKNGSRQLHSMVDGSMFAVNPELAGLWAAYMDSGTQSLYNLLSIGTGSQPVQIPLTMPGGVMQWVLSGRLIETMLDASLSFNDSMIAQLAAFSNINRYRLQYRVKRRFRGPFDCSFPDAFDQQWQLHFKDSHDVAAAIEFHAAHFVENRSSTGVPPPPARNAGRGDRWIEGESQVTSDFFCNACNAAINRLQWYRCRPCADFDMCHNCAPCPPSTAATTLAKYASKTIANIAAIHLDAKSVDPCAPRDLDPAAFTAAALRKFVHGKLDEHDLNVIRAITTELCTAIFGGNAKIEDDFVFWLVVRAAHRRDIPVGGSNSDGRLGQQQAAKAVFEYLCSASKRPKRILALDGGGIRGYFTIRVVQELIAKCYPRSDAASDGDPSNKEIDLKQQAFARTVDYFAGTSTGGLIAFCLAVDYPLKLMAEIYSNGARYFRKQGVGLNDAMYDPRPIHDKIDEILRWTWRKYQEGNTSFKECGKFNLNNFTLGYLDRFVLKPMRRVLIINAYDGTNSVACVFRSNNISHADLLVHDVLKSTMAAPVYFPIYQLSEQQADGTIQKRAMVDGGIFSNDPELAALWSVHTDTRTRNSYHLLSIGTGVYDKQQNTRVGLVDRLLGWFERKLRAAGRSGVLDWLPLRLINTIMDANKSFTEGVATQLAQFSHIKRMRINCKTANDMGLDDVRFPDVLNDEWPAFQQSSDMMAARKFYGKYFVPPPQEVPADAKDEEDEYNEEREEEEVDDEGL